MTRVVGLDLSLTSTGLSVVDERGFAAYENFKTKGKKSDTLEDRMVRLDGIASGVMKKIIAVRPELVVVEAPSFGSRFGSAHDRSGLWWILVSKIMEHAYPVAQVPPTVRAKYITGSGRGDKEVVLAHAIQRYVKDDSPRIPNDDVADATGLAAMGMRALGKPIDDPMPEANLEAMDGVLWPSLT